MTSGVTSGAGSSAVTESTRSAWPSGIAAWCVILASWPPPTMPTTGRPVRESTVWSAYPCGAAHSCPGQPGQSRGQHSVGDHLRPLERVQPVERLIVDVTVLDTVL